MPLFLREHLEGASSPVLPRRGALSADQAQFSGLPASHWSLRSSLKPSLRIAIASRASPGPWLAPSSQVETHVPLWSLASPHSASASKRSKIVWSSGFSAYPSHAVRRGRSSLSATLCWLFAAWGVSLQAIAKIIHGWHGWSQVVSARGCGTRCAQKCQLWLRAIRILLLLIQVAGASWHIGTDWLGPLPHGWLYRSREGLATYQAVKKTPRKCSALSSFSWKLTNLKQLGTGSVGSNLRLLKGAAHPEIWMPPVALLKISIQELSFSFSFM